VLPYAQAGELLLLMLQVTSLEELWKAAPDARLEDLDAGQEEPENQLTPAVLRYEDAAQYQVRVGAHCVYGCCSWCMRGWCEDTQCAVFLAGCHVDSFLWSWP
jgi:hypothetical protein